MSIHRKLMTVCCAAVLALGLAACGSSDDDTADTTPTTEMPEPMPTPAEQLATAQAAVTQAQTAVAALTATSSPSDRAAAYAALAGAQSALAEASGIPENEITLLKAEIARLQGVIDQAAMDAKAEADRIAAEMTAEAARIAALVAGTKTAETKEKAIDAEDGTAGLGGIGDDVTGTTVWTLGISRDRMATTVKITDPANAGDDDPKFALYMDLGNGRTMHTREMDADADGDVVEEVVIVSTDIAAPKAVAFAKWRDMELMTPQVLDVMKDDGQTPGGDETANALAIDGTDAAEAGRMMPARSTMDGMLNYSRDDSGAEPTMDVDEGVHDGTYNGAEGEFRCTVDSDSCSITFDDKGKVTAASTGWVFIPDMGATSDEPDYDYLRYGFWLMKTTDDEGVLTYDDVETFAGSSVTASGSVAQVTGSATYEGGANGVYAYSESNSDGSRLYATSGHFSADASLTATFDQTGDDPDTPDVTEEGTIAPNLLNTLSGTIDNFDLSGGEANQWSVNLQGDITENNGTASGSANGGGEAGVFSATFHGPTTDDTQPHSVVGEFDANFSNGSVAGAFGARKE